MLPFHSNRRKEKILVIFVQWLMPREQENLSAFQVFRFLLVCLFISLFKFVLLVVYFRALCLIVGVGLLRAQTLF